jgi:hypothetical protein
MIRVTDYVITPKVEDAFWSGVDKNSPPSDYTPHLGPCWLWKGGHSKSGYGVIRFYQGGGCVTLYVHKISYLLNVGAIPEGMKADHRCHMRLCANPKHLRAVTHAQNIQHRRGAQRNKRSGLRGVFHDRARDYWYAQVTANGHTHSSPSFRTDEDANAWAVAKRHELFLPNDADRLIAS